MDLYMESAEFLRAQIAERLPTPRVAIICGSGLGGLADTVDDEGKVELDYTSVPHFPRSTGKRAVPLSHSLRFLMLNELV